MKKILYYLRKWFKISASFNKLDNKQTWYGRVNDWKDLDITEKDILQCIESNVSGYMIEMAGDLDAKEISRFWTDDWVSNIEKKYKKLVRMTRAAGLWLFVSIVNDNMGQGKYGDKSPKLEKVFPMAQQLAKIVKDNKSKGVIVQPVAETQTNAGKLFDNYCKSFLNEFVLVYNGNGGFPGGTNGFDFRAVHPGSITKVCPSDAIVISDHGRIIRELTCDNSYNGSADQYKVTIWGNTVFQKSKCKILGYYAFQRMAHDKSTIKILGKLDKE